MNTLLPREGQPTPNQVTEILNAVSEPHRLQKIIQSIITNPEQLASVSVNAFGHGTGMERIELAVNGPYSLRYNF